MSLFGKKPSTPAPAPATKPAPLRESAHLIGAGMVIYGTLSAPGKLVIEGSVNGPIMGEASSEIVVAAGGMVEGPISAGSVRVIGTVEGPIRAQFVTIEDGGVVEGDIDASTLRTADGARVRGSVRTQVTEPLALPAPASHALSAVVEAD